MKRIIETMIFLLLSYNMFAQNFTPVPDKKAIDKEDNKTSLINNDSITKDTASINVNDHKQHRASFTKTLPIPVPKEKYELPEQDDIIIPDTSKVGLKPK